MNLILFNFYFLCSIQSTFYDVIANFFSLDRPDDLSFELYDAKLDAFESQRYIEMLNNKIMAIDVKIEDHNDALTGSFTEPLEIQKKLHFLEKEKVEITQSIVKHHEYLEYLNGRIKSATLDYQNSLEMH